MKNRVWKFGKLYYGRIISCIIFILALKFHMEALAVLSLLGLLVSVKRVKMFIERIMLKLENSKKGGIGVLNWDEPLAITSPYDSMISERRSGISSAEFSKYFEQGNFALRQHDIPKAKEMFGKAEERDPEDFQVQVSLGLICNLLGENKKSIEHSRKALHIKPNSFVPQFNLAVAINHFLGSENSLLEYIKAEDIAKRENMEDTVTVGKLNLFIGHDCREAGDFAEARKRYGKAETIFKLYNTAEAHFWRNDTLKNIELLERNE